MPNIVMEQTAGRKFTFSYLTYPLTIRAKQTRDDEAYFWVTDAAPWRSRDYVLSPAWYPMSYVLSHATRASKGVVKQFACLEDFDHRDRS
jgi:hypothetical protein